MEENKKLRTEYKQIRDGLTERARASYSNQICERLEMFIREEFNDFEVFLCFYPFRSEVDLRGLYQKLLYAGKKLYFPVSNNADMSMLFYRVTDIEAGFSSGTFGVMEPIDRTSKFAFDEAAICITPGLIFDRELNRVGYGAGFYDRLFEAYSDLIKLACAFDCQIAEELTMQKHDVKMDYILTNSLIFGEKYDSN